MNNQDRQVIAREKNIIFVPNNFITWRYSNKFNFAWQCLSESQSKDSNFRAEVYSTSLVFHYAAPQQPYLFLLCSLWFSFNWFEQIWTIFFYPLKNRAVWLLLICHSSYLIENIFKYFFGTSYITKREQVFSRNHDHTSFWLIFYSSCPIFRRKKFAFSWNSSNIALSVDGV